MTRFCGGNGGAELDHGSGGIEGLIDNVRLKVELAQIYAEATVMYKALRKAQPFGDLPLYLTNIDAADQAKLIQESRRVESTEDSLAGQIQAWLDTPVGSEDGFNDLDAAQVFRDETCMAQIWNEMLGRSGTIPTGDAMKIGKALLTVKWDRTRNTVSSHTINKKYGVCRVYTRT